MKVKQITRCGKADVYNMEVDETHDFVIQGGVVAHNCYDQIRYVCMENPIAPPKPVERPPKQYNPLDTDDDYEMGRYDYLKIY